MINKKSLWFLTLFSLILVLSVYYVTMPSELLIANESGKVTTKTSGEDSDKVVEITESEVITSLRVEADEEVSKQLDELKDILTNSKSTVDEKNNAFEKMKLLNITKGEEENLEAKILEEFSLKAFVKIDGDQIRVVVSADKLDLSSEEEKAELEKANKDSKEMFEKMKDALGGEVQEVRFTNRLKNHPVCLTSEGPISVEMEKVINSMPNDQKVKAKLVLEINEKHKIVDKLKELNSKEDKEALNKYTKVLYSQARLIEGLSLENPTEISNIICDIMSK